MKTRLQLAIGYVNETLTPTERLYAESVPLIMGEVKRMLAVEDSAEIEDNKTMKRRVKKNG